VVASRTEGDIHVVDFRLTDYLPLLDVSTEDQRARPIREFTDALKPILNGAFPDNTTEDYSRSPQRRSASFGPSPLTVTNPSGTRLITEGSDQSVGFERVVRYLSPGLTPARSTFHVAHIVDDADAEVPLSASGRLKLVPDKRYRLQVVHLEPTQLEDQPVLTIQVPDAIRALSDVAIPLRSRYDAIEIPLFVPARDDAAEGEIAIAIGGDLGYQVRIPVRIEPTHTQQLLNPAVALIGAVLIASPGLLGDGHTPTKVTLAVLGAVALAFAAWDRRHRGLTG
jgi:hypothetical protein